MNEPLLKVQQLQKTIGNRVIVEDLSFHVHAAEVVGLLGPNGAGKTTSFYMTMGLIKPDAGRVFFNNQEITKEPVHKRAKMGLGYLAQEPSVFRSLTVEENILCILETLELSKQQQKERLFSLLNELKLEHLKNKKAATLSGGERRRLEITRALVTEPKLLLLDEPFANIDPIAVSDVKSLIGYLKKRGISVLITDHNAREIFSIVDRSYLVQNGKILLSGSVEELISHPEAKKNYFGEDFSI